MSTPIGDGKGTRGGCRLGLLLATIAALLCLAAAVAGALGAAAVLIAVTVGAYHHLVVGAERARRRAADLDRHIGQALALAAPVWTSAPPDEETSCST